MTLFWTWASVVAVLLAPAAAGAQVDFARTGPATPLAVGETFTLQSKALGETRRINVWWPPEYADSASVRLPVLYMPAGSARPKTLYLASSGGGLPELTQRLAVRRLFKPAAAPH